MCQEQVADARERQREQREAVEFAKAAEDRLRGKVVSFLARYCGYAALGIFAVGMLVGFIGPDGWSMPGIIIGISALGFAYLIGSADGTADVQEAVVEAYERGVPLKAIRAAVDEAKGYDDAVSLLEKMQPERVRG